ncbi:MAG: hypothetical protein RR346_03840 [Bacteroidales bacterium]
MKTEVNRIRGFRVNLPAPVLIDGVWKEESLPVTAELDPYEGDDFKTPVVELNVPYSLTTDTGILLPVTHLAEVAAALIELGNDLRDLTTRGLYLQSGRGKLLAEKRSAMIRMFDKYHQYEE